MQKNVLDYLKNSVCKFPDKLAFSDDKISYTYSQLNKCAKIIAQEIMNGRDIKNSPIVVLVDRSVNSLASFFRCFVFWQLLRSYR